MIAAALSKPAVAGVPVPVAQEFLPFLLTGMHSVSVAVPLVVTDQGDHHFVRVVVPETRLSYSDALMMISAAVAAVALIA